MTLNDRTAAGQTDTLSFDFDLQHAPAKVWRALTDPALLTQWLLPTLDFSLTPGAAFQFRTQAQPGWDGVVHCTLLDADAPHSLRYAWVVGDLDTVVTFVLTPTDTGTRLSLTHAGFKPTQPQNFGGARYGWKMMGGRLLELLGRDA